MSTFAKIMVVVNFVLAFAFLAAAGTLHGAAESWKSRHGEVTAKLTQDIKSLEDQVAARQKDLDQSRLELGAAKQEADNYKGQLKVLNDGNAILLRELENKKGELDKLIEANRDSSKSVSDLTARNEAISTQLATSEAERKQAIEAKSSLDENLARSEARADSAEKAVAAHEKSIKTMTDQMDALNTERAWYMEKYGKAGVGSVVAALRGVVQAASAKDDVFVLSVGAKDGVKVGYEFTVSRGDHYVSTIVIDSVFPNHSAGHTKANMKKMDVQPGDAVATATGL